MSKVVKKTREIVSWGKDLGVKTTMFLGALGAWIYSYEKFKEIKDNRRVITKKAINIAEKIHKEIGNEFVDLEDTKNKVQELLDDAQVRKNRYDISKKNINND